MTSLLADSITRIRNAQMARHAYVDVCYSKKVQNVLSILKEEGYIELYQPYEERKGVKFIRIELKYNRGEPVIKKISMISKPGCPIYSCISKLPREKEGLGIKILSTSKGVISDHIARKLNVGGEVLLSVF